ncbi:hypothetical protein [Streptomyces spectabilis]|uniref:Uncharacterized protein n=1 Tax=Streptomyces spectabilis TaxID=68270 RepID=A0A5P2X2T9_STRST|nr:hypothetical protein [Streptomyces spectabilis]MBB5107260.1 hypothetical protein [Streptomyces spectabilis]MCI3899960.1 hypothetical protein [Streptomyces spectabilis]QEV57599.1 hypothetical protein CP982_01765 [Streptomyces spectabilis]
MTSTLKKIAPAALSTVFVLGVAAPSASAADGVDAGSTAVNFYVKRNTGDTSSFRGTLTWDGKGGYHVTGEINAITYPVNRITSWLEYSGEHESWKNSPNEADSGNSKYGYAKIDIAGTLPKGERLDLRLNTWQSQIFWAWQPSDKKTYTIS